MTKRPLSSVAMLALAAVLLTGCTSAADSTPSQSEAAVQSGPDPEALREGLGDIDPALDADESVDDADAICLEIEAGADDAAIEEEVRSLFTGRADGELSDEQISSIVEVIKSQYCG